MTKTKLVYMNMIFLIILFIPLFTRTLQQEKAELRERIELIQYKTNYVEREIAKTVKHLKRISLDGKKIYNLSIEEEVIQMQYAKRELYNNCGLFVLDIFKVDGKNSLKSYISLRDFNSEDKENQNVLNEVHPHFNSLNFYSEIRKLQGKLLKKVSLKKNDDDVIMYLLYPFYSNNELSEIYGIKLDLKRGFEMIAKSSDHLYKEAYYINEDGSILSFIYTPILKKIFLEESKFFKMRNNYQISKFKNVNYAIVYRVNKTLVFIGTLFISFIFSSFLTIVVKKILEYVTKNKKIYSNSVFDSLTGILNRRGFYELFEGCFNISGIAIFDIDNFKKINDKYGHSIGDLVLKKVADVIEKNLCECRVCHGKSIKCYLKGKMCVRWGGEEIVIGVTPNDKGKFLALLEKIRLEISKIVFEEYPDLIVTVSIGSTLKPIKSLKDFNDNFEIIDKNLYTAKNNGKNQNIFS